MIAWHAEFFGEGDVESSISARLQIEGVRSDCDCMIATLEFNEHLAVSSPLLPGNKKCTKTVDAVSVKQDARGLQKPVNCAIGADKM